MLMLMFGTLTGLAAIQATIVNCWAHNYEADVRKGQGIQLNARQFARTKGKCSRFVSLGQPFSMVSSMSRVSRQETKSSDFLRISGKQIQSLVLVLLVWFVCVVVFYFFLKVFVYKARCNLDPRLQTSFIFECLALSEISCLRANSCCYFKFHFVVPRTWLQHQLYPGPRANAEIKFQGSHLSSFFLFAPSRSSPRTLSLGGNKCDF